MRKELKKYCINQDASILEGIQAIDLSDEGFTLVINAKGQLQGMLTDGDVRRALLSGATLDQPLAPHMRIDFLRADPQSTRTEILDMMQARKIRHVPVVDANGDLQGIHLLSSMIRSSPLPNWAVI